MKKSTCWRHIFSDWLVKDLRSVHQPLPGRDYSSAEKKVKSDIQLVMCLLQFPIVPTVPNRVKKWDQEIEKKLWPSWKVQSDHQPYSSWLRQSHLLCIIRRLWRTTSCARWRPQRLRAGASTINLSLYHWNVTRHPQATNSFCHPALHCTSV